MTYSIGDTLPNGAQIIDTVADSEDGKYAYVLAKTWKELVSWRIDTITGDAFHGNYYPATTPITDVVNSFRRRCGRPPLVEPDDQATTTYQVDVRRSAEITLPAFVRDLDNKHLVPLLVAAAENLEREDWVESSYDYIFTDEDENEV